MKEYGDGDGKRLRWVTSYGSWMKLLVERDKRIVYLFINKQLSIADAGMPNF